MAKLRFQFQLHKTTYEKINITEANYE